MTTPKEILQRIYDEAKAVDPNPPGVCNIPITDIEAALGIKKGPFPAQYGAMHPPLGVEESGVVAGLRFAPVNRAAPAPPANLERDEVLRMWADMASWLFGPPLEGGFLEAPGTSCGAGYRFDGNGIIHELDGCGNMTSWSYEDRVGEHYGRLASTLAHILREAEQ